MPTLTVIVEKNKTYILTRINHTQLAKMSIDKIFDLTAGVYFYFFLNIKNRTPPNKNSLI